MKTLSQFLNENRLHEAEDDDFHKKVAAHHRAIAAKLRKDKGEFANTSKKDADDHDKIASHIEAGRHGRARAAFNNMDTLSRDYAFEGNFKNIKRAALYHRVSMNPIHPAFKSHKNEIQKHNELVSKLHRR